MPPLNIHATVVIAEESNEKFRAYLLTHIDG